MIQNMVSRNTFRELAAALALCVISLPVLAGMLGNADSDVPTREAALQHATPAVKDANGDTLGIFGGMTRVPTGIGNDRAAVTIVSSSGYLLPVLNGGETFALAPLFFTSKDCSGTPYAPATAPSQSYPAYPGLVFRSPVDHQLYYISRFALPAITETRSRIEIGDRDEPQCVKGNSKTELLQSVANNTLTTGFEDSCCAGPVSITFLNYQENPGQGTNDSNWLDLDPRPGTGPVDDDESEEMVYDCAPGCMAENIGDKLCDISCYNDACRFDDGDCDTLSEQELRQESDRLCSPGCFLDDVGDGFCDDYCNTPACRYDEGDCNSGTGANR